jgi:hypothetical protein
MFAGQCSVIVHNHPSISRVYHLFHWEDAFNVKNRYKTSFSSFTVPRFYILKLLLKFTIRISL